MEKKINKKDLQRENIVTRVHSILIVIILVQITLITLGFYLQFSYFIEQNHAFENQIIDVIDQTLNKLASGQRLLHKRSVSQLWSNESSIYSLSY